MLEEKLSKKWCLKRKGFYWGVQHWLGGLEPVSLKANKKWEEV
jgi:hypothetical protein